MNLALSIGMKAVPGDCLHLQSLYMRIERSRQRSIPRVGCIEMQLQRCGRGMGGDPYAVDVNREAQAAVARPRCHLDSPMHARS